MARFTVGLTGGLASGKSTVAEWLEAEGLTVVDADDIVARLYLPGGEGAERVRELFGADFLKPDGGVDAPALARRVFADTEARRRLEQAIHPLVGREFASIAERSSGIVVFEATLLVESGLAEALDLVVTVEADRAIRLDRAVHRGLDERQAEARLDAQGDGAVRRAGAHRVLRNDGTLPELRAQVDALIADARELASVRGNDAP
ncbi:MAG: dephospho-CoA kinase [Thermoanaerobaculia bacterium]